MRDLVVTTLQQARRLIVIVVGFTVLLIGLAMVVLPGPAIVVIPLGLAILATEFLWARRLLRHMTQEAERLRSMVGGKAIPHRPRLEDKGDT